MYRGARHRYIECDIEVIETDLVNKERYLCMDSSISRRATEAASHAHECPLCNCGSNSEDDIYRHLLVSHRKSTLADALLDRVNSDD